MCGLKSFKCYTINIYFVVFYIFSIFILLRSVVFVELETKELFLEPKTSFVPLLLQDL